MSSKQVRRAQYEKPVIVYEGTISTRAGTVPIRSAPDAGNPVDLFPGND